jgi:hypothetical protein
MKWSKLNRENIRSNLSRIKVFKLREISFRVFTGMILTLILLILIFLALGSSQILPLSTSSSAPEIEGQPQGIDNPHGPIGGNPLPTADIPPFTPPPDAFNRDFPGGGFGDSPDRWTGNPPDNDMDFPTVELPTIQPPGGGIGDITPPPQPERPINTAPRPIDPGDGGVGNNDSQDIFDFSFGNRSVKAKFMPVISFFNYTDFNINLGFFGAFTIDIEAIIDGMIFVLLISLIIIGYNVLLPKVLQIRNIVSNEYADIETLAEADLIKAQETKIKAERMKKLLVFQDHVDEIIERSEFRLKTQSAYMTILSGYQELDEAFNSFAALKRDQGTTPLEHAHKIFETGEINNDILEKLVQLFYIVRFGEKEVFESHGREFIEYLKTLIVQGEIHIELQS